MAISENEFDLLLRYTDDELSPEEEIEFVKRLSVNKELQNALEIELILRTGSGTKREEMMDDYSNTTLESADQFLARTASILTEPTEKTTEREQKTPVVNLWSRRTASAAAVVVVIVTAAFLYFKYTSYQKELADNRGKKPVDKGIVSSKDSALETPLVKDTGNTKNNDTYLAQLFDDYYNRYKINNDDPIEISLYYQFYADKEYAKVLKATEADYETKGSSTQQEQTLLKYYMLLYKALSYLETGKPVKAAVLLQTIVKNSKQRNNLYYNSQWYLLMTYLKLNDAKNTKSVLTDIINNKNNPYSKTASEINKFSKEK